MTTGTALIGPTLLVAAAAVCLVLPGPRTSPGAPALIGRVRRRCRSGPVTPACLAGVLAGLGALALLGGLPGIVAGLGCAVAVTRSMSRLESRRERRDRAAVARDLPLALDLLDSCLCAGQPPSRAARVVGEALGGLVGARLVSVGRAAELGAPAAEAWAAVAALAGGGAAVGRVVRAGESGSALAPALRALAERLRAARAVAGAESVRRIGVVVVLPLGLCFLPAFLCVGVLPMVIGILGSVLHR